MPKPLKTEQMSVLDKQYQFTKSQNSEIADIWYVMAVAADYTPAYALMDEFLKNVGRRKFLEPVYEEMINTGKEQMAKDIYKKYRGNYHPLAQGTFDRLIFKTDQVKAQ
jgi:leukotriene-A4 hydrolase